MGLPVRILHTLVKCQGRPVSKNNYWIVHILVNKCWNKNIYNSNPYIKTGITN